MGGAPITPPTVPERALRVPFLFDSQNAFLKQSRQAYSLLPMPLPFARLELPAEPWIRNRKRLGPRRVDGMPPSLNPPGLRVLMARDRHPCRPRLRERNRASENSAKDVRELRKGCPRTAQRKSESSAQQKRGSLWHDFIVEDVTNHDLCAPLHIIETRSSLYFLLYIYIYLQYYYIVCRSPPSPPLLLSLASLI